MNTKNKLSTNYEKHALNPNRKETHYGYFFSFYDDEIDILIRFLGDVLSNYKSELGIVSMISYFLVGDDRHWVIEVYLKIEADHV